MQITVGGYKESGRLEKPPPDAGCTKCNKCRVVCPVLVESKTFKSENTKKIYNIYDWLIYLCTCRKFGGQYVGKSKTSFKIRHSNDKIEIRNQKWGLGNHYGGETGCGYAIFSVILIEQIKIKTMDFLAEREVSWQNQLRVYPENGAKGHC